MLITVMWAADCFFISKAASSAFLSSGLITRGISNLMSDFVTGSIFSSSAAFDSGTALTQTTILSIEIFVLCHIIFYTS